MSRTKIEQKLTQSFEENITRFALNKKNRVIRKSIMILQHLFSQFAQHFPLFQLFSNSIIIITLPITRILL